MYAATCEALFRPFFKFNLAFSATKWLPTNQLIGYFVWKKKKFNWKFSVDVKSRDQEMDGGPLADKNSVEPTRKKTDVYINLLRSSFSSGVSSASFPKQSTGSAAPRPCGTLTVSTPSAANFEMKSWFSDSAHFNLL